jgi:two-component system, chemotaxis family, chemotaxis protein CheY
MSAPSGPVLVVDDNPDIREAIVALLQINGFAAVGAENGKRALDYLQRNEQAPCAILLDLMMPVMDGVEFRRRQLAKKIATHVPIIVVSAYGQLTRARSLQVQDYISKPIDFDHLLAVVKQHCLTAA